MTVIDLYWNSDERSSLEKQRQSEDTTCKAMEKKSVDMRWKCGEWRCYGFETICNDTKGIGME